MQKIKAYLLALYWLLGMALMSNEGMWYPTALPDTLFDILDEAGSELSAENIYSEQNSSLKDQVVYLSNGHSGVILSEQGLLLTNYTPFIPFVEKNDSLQKGFTALQANNEIPIRNLYALQLKHTVDITDKINNAITNDYDEAVRKQQLDSICQDIYLGYPTPAGHMVQIEKDANERYFLYDYVRYDDIRLVYLPANHLATAPWQQNPWVTQRHLADFCLLRLYTDRDNNPAVYSEFNQPAQELSNAVISQNPKHAGDPVFYLGYPNGSSRGLLSDDIEEQWADDSTKLAVWQFIAQYRNLPKQAQQETIVREHSIFERMQLVQEKRANEQAFTYWAANHPHFETALRYGNLLPLLHNTYTNRRFHLEQYRTNAELVEHVTALQMALLLLDMNAENETATLRQINQLYKNFQATTEKAWLSTVLDYYRGVCDTTYMPAFYGVIDKKYKGNTQKHIDYVFKKSFLTDEKRFTKYLDNPTEEQRANDPLLSLGKEWKQQQRLHYLLYAQHHTAIERSKRMYRIGRQLKDSTSTPPDANYTLRLGYGNIMGYELNNGINIDAFATLNNRNRISYLQNPPSTLDSSWAKALESDTIYTDFYTTCDAPYGRMGQAVYSVHGELLGIMSQTNPEGQYNGYWYNKDFQRTLVADIHYLLFLLEHSQASYLLDELELGEPEQLVQIQYVAPTPDALITLPDSITPSDSIPAVFPADSIALQEPFGNASTSPATD